MQPTLDELRAEAMEWGRKPRAFGAWYVTEHMVRAMRAYGWTIIVGALGQPILYLLGLAVGLAALIDAPVAEGGVEVPYLVFVAPALLMTSTIAVASEEFTYPVMAGSSGAAISRLQRVGALGRQVATGVISARGAHDRGRRRLHRVPLSVRRDPATSLRAGCHLRRDARRGSRSACRSWLCGIHRRRQGPVRARPAFHLHADVPVLGHLLPARLAAALAAVDRLDLAALACDRARAVVYIRAPIEPAMLVVHFGYLSNTSSA